MRRLPVLLLALLALAVLGAGVSAAAKAKSPNPCQAVPKAAVLKALGKTANSHLLSQGSGSAKLFSCVYVAGAARVQIDIGPKAFLPSTKGTPKGTVVKSLAQFGSKGALLYNSNKLYAFANVIFSKGVNYGGVWSNKLSPTQVTTLAAFLYRNLK
jgi:hypothetical protein